MQQPPPIKTTKKILLFTIAILILVAGYYTGVVLNARSKTPAIVYNALHSGRMKLALDDFTSAQLKALLKIQDPNFYAHKGVDFSTPGMGSTTVSQALVKMYYFDDFKPGIQKIKQTLIARFAFDNMIPKDTIIKLFINEVYMGNYKGLQIKGFENAAICYYNKPFNKLTNNEFLSLLAMIGSPNKLHCIFNKEANHERVLRIKSVLSGEYQPLSHGDWLYGQKL